MTGTVTSTEELNGQNRKIVFDWLSDASGDATGSTTHGINADIKGVVFKPDTGGTVPTDQYDVTLTDANSIDLLNGQGANLSSTNSIAVTSDLLPITGDKLALTVANGGNAKGGVVYVFLV